jgi:superoxide dismutase, Cu-Zn family
MKKSLLSVVVLLALVACPKKDKTTGPVAKPTPIPGAVGAIESRSGSTLIGEVSFTQNGDKVDVMIKVSGATPGEHAVHIHEKGDCSAPDAKSAGGHFNPNGVDHGNPTGDKHHPGDFGNLTIGADGSGTLNISAELLTIADGPLSVVGKALIVHEKPDDFTTQPTGNAGGRQGCAVIVAK